MSHVTTMWCLFFMLLLCKYLCLTCFEYLLSVMTFDTVPWRYRCWLDVLFEIFTYLYIVCFVLVGSMRIHCCLYIFTAMSYHHLCTCYGWFIYLEISMLPVSKLFILCTFLQLWLKYSKFINIAELIGGLGDRTAKRTFRVCTGVSGSR